VKIRRQRRGSLGRDFLCRHMKKADSNLERAVHADLASNGTKYSITNWK
jgi:hypothetical protein